MRFQELAQLITQLKQLKIVDLSIPIQHTISEPSPRIQYFDHSAGAKLLARLGRISPQDFPGGLGLAWEEIRLSTHTGTHLDAPWHFGPELHGIKAKTIDQIPLEWCFGHGLVIDISHRAAGEYATLDDLSSQLASLSYAIQPGDIVLFRTGCDKLWGKSRYFEAHPGISPQIVEYLVAQGVKLMGTDGYGFDTGFGQMFKKFRLGQKDALWPAHLLGRKLEYLHIEKLANLDKLPRYGFLFICFPIAIKHCSAAWVRAVAFIP